MRIVKTILHSGLRKPDSYTVECGKHKANFKAGEQAKVGEWVKSLWKNGEIAPAYVFYNIDWDCDHVLYCRFDYEIDDLGEIMD